MHADLLWDNVRPRKAEVGGRSGSLDQHVSETFPRVVVSEGLICLLGMSLGSRLNVPLQVCL